jgi:hypothetical protein
VTKCESQSQLGTDKPETGRASIDYGRGAAPPPAGIEGFLNDAGRGEQGTGYDLPHFEGVEVQAFIQFGREVLRLRPSIELTELLFDDGAGAIFYGTADNSAFAPRLGSKSEASVHQSLTI